MSRLAYFILIYFSFILQSFSQDILGVIDNEQKNYLYSICNKINKHTGTKYIKLRSANSEEETHSIKKLLNKIRHSTGHELKPEAHNIIFLDETYYRKKLTTVDGPRFFVFSKIDGYKILKFDCTVIKLGRKKIGPFEIPYDSNIIVNPTIEFYTRS